MHWLIFVAAVFAGGDPINPTLGPGDDAFITRQTAALLAEVGKTLDAVPPDRMGAVGEHRRHAALQIMDRHPHVGFVRNRPGNE